MRGSNWKKARHLLQEEQKFWSPPQKEGIEHLIQINNINIKRNSWETSYKQ